MEEPVSGFHGEEVKHRMDQVRAHIIGIRKPYHAASSDLMREAGKLFHSEVREIKNPAFESYRDSLFSADRGFADLVPERVDARFSAAWLYTSNEGYFGPFKWAKDVFRAANPSPDKLRLATFLIELINVDLFNYWYLHPESAAYEGWAYRGLWMNRNDFNELERKAADPDIRNRYRSIPLALDSCSTNPQVAMEFAQGKKGEVAVLQKIRVLGLGAKSSSYYGGAFPGSVVSPICATNIKEISAFPEGEIILRGGFYQLLQIRDDRDPSGSPLKVVDMVAMNTNRDHPTTPQGDAGAAPRNLIDALVTAERNRFCRDYYREMDMPKDAVAYQEALERQEKSFTDSFAANPPWAP